MRSFLISFIILLITITVFPACKSEDDKYSGIGKIIADRNEMRYDIAGDSKKDKGTSKSSGKKTDSASNYDSATAARKKTLTTNVLNKKNVVIVDTSSGAPLARGVAYVDQNGKILKIKLDQ